MPACRAAACAHYSQTEWGLAVHEAQCMLRKQGPGRVVDRAAAPPTRRVRRKAPALPPALGGAGPRLEVDAVREGDASGPSAAAPSIGSAPLASADAEGDISGRKTGAQEGPAPDSEARGVVEELGLALAQAIGTAGSKAVGNIIRLLRHHAFSLPLFVMSCTSVSDCKGLATRVFDESMAGFKKKKAEDPGHGACIMYAKDPIAVLQRQIALSRAESSLLFCEELQQSAYSHPTNAELGVKGGKAVRDAVEESESPAALWLHSETDGRRSFVGLGQLYSDKSVTTMKASGVTFYPIHVLLHNFSEALRRKIISTGLSIVGYLPVEFMVSLEDPAAKDEYESEEYEDEPGVGVGNSQKVRGGVSRPERLRLLHIAIADILQPLASAAVIGFEASDCNGTALQCHFCIGSYCCDLPEAKDLTSVLHGNASVASCHRCYCDKAGLAHPGITGFPMRTAAQTLRRQFQSEEKRKRAMGLKGLGQLADGTALAVESANILREVSITSQPPALWAFPFAGIVPCLDMNQWFCYEPLHNAFLGIWRMLWSAASARLSSKDMKTSALLTSAGCPRSFSAIRSRVLNNANLLLGSIQRDSPARGLHIDFSTKGKGDRWNGFFKQESIMGMLEASDMRCLAIVAPFIGAYFDRCCGQESDAPCTTVFSRFADVMSFAARRVWTEDRALQLEKEIDVFKKAAVLVFGAHQASGMGTLKFHLLDHLAGDIRRMGGMTYGDAGLFEFAHTIFKKCYRATSKRSRSAMQETVAAMGIAEAIGARLQPNAVSDVQPRVSRGSRIDAAECDSGSLARDGVFLTLAAVQSALSAASGSISALGAEAAAAEEMVRDIGSDAARAMIRLCLDTAQKKDPYASASSVTIQKVTSGYISGLEAPTARNRTSASGSVVLRDTGRRISQRVVASHSFYGSEAPRFDCVLIEQPSDGSLSDEYHIHQDDEAATELLPVCVGQALVLFRVLLSRFGKRTFLKDPASSDEENMELALVKYFDICEAEDGVDTALGCVKLRWSRLGGSPSSAASRTEPFAGWYDVIPFCALRATVHVVRGDYYLEETERQKQRERNNSQYLYINRWYRDSEEVAYYKH